MLLSTLLFSERVVTKNGNDGRTSAPIPERLHQKARDAGVSTAWSYGYIGLLYLRPDEPGHFNHFLYDEETTMQQPGIIANSYRHQIITPASFPSRPAWGNMPE